MIVLIIKGTLISIVIGIILISIVIGIILIYIIFGIILIYCICRILIVIYILKQFCKLSCYILNNFEYDRIILLWCDIISLKNDKYSI